MKSKWIVFFSQSGTEIVDLAITLDRWPDYIITNNKDVSSINPMIRSRITHVLTNEESKTLDVLKTIALATDLITLHGWLKIVPANICSKYNIYNGHPGLISEYPELKGKDPQIRAFKNIQNYDRVGSVVHKVTAEVDEGEVVISRDAQVKKSATFGDIFHILRETSRKAWLAFLEDQFKIKL